MELVPKIKEGVKQTNDLLLRDFTEEEKVSFKKNMDKLFTTIGSLPEPDYIVQAYKRNNK